MLQNTGTQLNPGTTHVGHPSFGEDIDSINPITEAIKIAPVLCSSDTKLLLTDRYETTYGICNHDIADSFNRPLALIAMHPTEDTCKDSMLYNRIKQFADCNAGKFFNISLTEFLDYPRDICIHILELSTQMQKSEGVVADNMLNQLGQK